MWADMKKALSDVGRLAAARPPEAANGYLAERPVLIPHLLRVWSPCGCCLTWMNAAASVLTQCDSTEHDFSWAQAQEALAALQAAEGASAPAAPEPKLAIVKLEKPAVVVPEKKP